MNFANYLVRAARDAPEKTALTDPTREVPFAELDAETSALADSLADLGVEPGDRVAIYLPNSVAFVSAYFGAMKLGAIPFPINLRFQGEEIAYVLKDAGAGAVVTNGAFEDDIADLDAPGVDDLIVAGGDRGHDFESLVAAGDEERGIYPRKEDELADIMYTSGTTGRPKGVEHSHRNLSTNARALLKCMGWSRHDVGLTVNPCFHVSGLHVTVTPMLTATTTNHLLPSWDPETALSTVEDRSVTTSFCIATMIVDLVNYEDAHAHDTASLAVVGCGGAPMPKDLIETFEERFGCPLLEGYGMTETTPAAAINTIDQVVRKPGSIGPVIQEVVDVRIEDPETGEAVERGELGELLWHGDTVTPGYFRMPEKNEDAFVERTVPAGQRERGGETSDETRRWLRSGDIGYMDEDGHLFLEDRIDDMIITGGENVYPREVEDALYGLDGVAEAAVIGTPHERFGEVVTAILVRDDEDLTVEDVETYCDEALADYKRPRRVEFVESMPKTSTRKVDKVTLREEF